MRKSISIFLCLILILISVPFAAFAKDGKNDPEIISGTKVFEENDADKMVIGGKEFSPSADGINCTLKFKVTDCDSKSNAVFLNDEKIGDINPGENEFQLPAEKLAGDKISIKILLAANGYVYDEGMVYGEYNLDDIKIDYVKLVFTDEIYPESTDLFMPIKDKAGYTVKNVPYSNSLDIGDGWIKETNLGGSKPNTPIGCSFNFKKPSFNGMFIFDSTKFEDGEYTAEFYSEGKKIKEKKISCDNNAPKISFSVPQNGTVAKNSSIEYKIDDANLKSAIITVDGKAVRKIDCKNLDLGRHTAKIEAADTAGHAAINFLVFNVAKNDMLDVSVGEKSVTMTAYQKAEIFGADLLTDIRMFHNPLGSFNMDKLRYENEVQISFDEKENIVTSAVGNTLPYQSFVVNTTKNKGNVIISYTGTTGNGCDIILKAWNYKDGKWDTIARTESGKSVSVPVDAEIYSHDKKIRINAMPYISGNGSNTILWNSDTQYYSRYDDLNDLYTSVSKYAVDMYNQNKIGYAMHTGDIVDRINQGDEIAEKEYRFASEAQKILDDAKVPNGIVSGNHDVFKDPKNGYEHYFKYFGEDRYKDFEWYGGSLNNNMHHYDLVTLGAYDFVFLYIGCFRENDPDVIAWAKAVCDAYPDRNVILCTHEYIDENGQYVSDRAKNLFEKIVVPNENIKMVLCGHIAGVCDQVHKIPGTDREVIEILADYQFSELGVGPQHVENSCTCDGEGFVRLMTFTEGNQVISETYSPKHDMYNFFPAYQDSFVYDIDLIPSKRSICTTEFSAAVNCKDLGEFGKDKINLSSYGAFYASFGDEENTNLSKVYVLKEFKTGDKNFKDENKYSVEFERVSSNGTRNVDENLIKGDSTAFPDEKLVEVGLDLMPKKPSALSKASGSDDFSLEMHDSGAVTVSHTKDKNGTWVTLRHLINKKIDVSKYNRLYFSVTVPGTAKWNLCLNLNGQEINFSQNMYKKFGYVNSVPSDIEGSWHGYIDLSDEVKGEVTVDNAYLVASSPDLPVTFNYYFLGSSDAGKVRFITDEETVSVKEAAEGTKIDAPVSPYKTGYKFEGWYSDKEFKNKVEFPVEAKKDVTELYARFEPLEKSSEEKYYDTEIITEKTPVSKIVLICLSIVCVIAMTIFLFVKKAKTKPKANPKSEGNKK